MMVWNQVLLALIDVPLPHATNACRNFPIVGKGVEVLDVIIDGVQPHCQFWRLFLFEFSSIVLLITNDGLQCSIAKVPCIIADGFIVKHFLEGRNDAITLPVKVATNKFAFRDAWCETDSREAKPAMAPSSINTKHSLNVSFLKE